MSTPSSGPTYRDISAWRRLCGWLWKVSGFLGTAVLLSLGVNILSSWLTSSHGRIAADSPFEWILIHWPLLLIIGCCLFLIALLAGMFSRDPMRSPTSSLTQQNRTHMLHRLQYTYREMITQSLQGAAWLELGLTDKPDAVQNTSTLLLRQSNQPERVLPTGTTIVQVYEEAHHELLILGEPGAGKSTLLLELARQLTEQAEHDETHPLPIILPLSSWAVRRPPLHEWMHEQLSLMYNVPRSVSKQWIQGEQILPLLDGLDEMEEPARIACIQQINTYHREHLHSLVVCSRSVEYAIASIHERLSLQSAVVVQPLTQEHVAAYLIQGGKPLAALRSVLKKNLILQELTTTPLMLSILFLTYQGKTARDLPQMGSVQEQQKQIFASYVDRMVERKGNFQHYPSQCTHLWLGWLAREMQAHKQIIFYLEQLQPDWLPPRQRFFYRLSIGLIAGLILGLLFGLVGGLLFGLVGGLLGILVCGLLFGLVGSFAWGLLFELDRWSWKKARNEMTKGLIERLVRRQQTGIVLPEVLTWSWKKARNELIFGLLVGLVFGLAIGLVRGLLVGLLSGLVSGLLVGLRGGLSTNQFTERLHLSPNEGIRRSTKNGLFLAVIVGLLLELGFGLVFVLAKGPVFELVKGLLVGLVFGLTFGLLFVLQSVVQHYILRVFFWRTQVFPWHAVRFLEDARTRILLRRVGGGYVFVHRLLMDYLADQYQTGSTPVFPSPPTASNETPTSSLQA